MQDREDAIDDWELQRTEPSSRAPREEADLPGCFHTDACAGYVVAAGLRQPSSIVTPPRHARVAGKKEKGSSAKGKKLELPPPPLPPSPPPPPDPAMRARAIASAEYVRPLRFMLPRMQLGFIAVCCDMAAHAKISGDNGKGFCSRILVEGGALFSFDGAPLEPTLSTPEEAELKHDSLEKCLVLQESFLKPVESAEGHLLLTVALPRSLHEVRITHIIAF